jgi:hypothetical protein
MGVAGNAPTLVLRISPQMGKHAGLPLQRTSLYNIQTLYPALSNPDSLDLRINRIIKNDVEKS